MPPLIGALAGAAITAAISSTVGVVAASAIGLVVSAGVSFVANAILKPSGGTGSGGGFAAPSYQPLENKITIRQAAAARPVVFGNTRVGGVMVFVHAVENDQRLLIGVALAGHRIQAIDEVWFADEVLPLDGSGNVTGGTYAGKALVRKHLGALDQAADANFIAAAPGVWTAEHRLGGIAWLAIELVYDQKVFPAGIPNISAVVRGKNDIWDPRTDTTGYSANSALVVANYLCDARYGLAADRTTGLDSAALIAAANACDETVPLADGTSEKRYETDGAFLSSIEPQEALGRLLGAMHGRAPFDGERWRIQAGVWQAPTLEFDDTILAAGPRLQTLQSGRDSFNAVKGTFVGPANNWQQADFPPLVSQTFKELDGGIERFKDIELPFTRSASRAQRLAKIDLLKARQPIRATMPCMLSAWRSQAGDTIAWTSTRYGWINKPFEIDDLGFAIQQSPSGPVLGITLQLVETAAAVYDWSTSEESRVDPAPNTDLPDPFSVLPPTNLVVSEELYATRDGAGVKARANMSWSASPDGFVDVYQPEFRVAGGTWQPLPRVPGLVAQLNDLKPGAYEFSVAAVNVLGVPSPYVATVRDIAGLLAPPAPPQQLSLFASGGWARLRWGPTTDTDVRIGGSAQIRFAAVNETPFAFGEGGDTLGEAGFDLGAGADWEAAAIVAEKVAGAATTEIVALRTGCYLLDFIDSSGQLSGTPDAVLGVQVAAGWSVLASLVEDPGFAGGKTNCAVASGQLVQTAGSATATYAFASSANLGAVHAVRVTADVAALVVNNDALFDSAELVDSSDAWDEVVLGTEASSWLEMRSTLDDPAGAPAWTGWVRVETQEIEARAIEFRYQMAATDTDYGMTTTGLGAVVEERA